MNLSYGTAAFVASIVFAAPVLAQQEPNRPATPPARPPAATPAAPVAETPNVQPASPAALESQRRREERSVDLEELLTRVSEATGKKFLVDPRVRARVYGVPRDRQSDVRRAVDDSPYTRLRGRRSGRAREHRARRLGAVHADARAESRRRQRAGRRNRHAHHHDSERSEPRACAAPLDVAIRTLVRGHRRSERAGQADPDGHYANIRRMTELINTLSR